MRHARIIRTLALVAALAAACAADTIPAVIYIVRQTDGPYQARDPGQVPGLLAEANNTLWQRGHALAQSGPIRYINNDAWLDHTDVYNPANTNLLAMLNTTNSNGRAVEIYFVRSLKDGQGREVRGVRWPQGIAIASGGGGRTTGHEVLHGCGAEDIYTEDDSGNNPVEGPVREGWMPLDWGGGYHSPDLTQRQVIERLIMHSGGDGIVLPRGSIYGYRHTGVGGGSATALGLASVGLDSCTNFPGSH